MADACVEGGTQYRSGDWAERVKELHDDNAGGPLRAEEETEQLTHSPTPSTPPIHPLQNALVSPPKGSHIRPRMT